MARKTKKTKKTKKKPSMSTASIANKSCPSWVDRLEFEPINESRGDSDNDNNIDRNSRLKRLDVRIVSWNILAHAYLSRRSHRNLPPSHEQVVFVPERRNALIQKTLRQLVTKLHLNVICLQEVDLPIVKATLEDLQFDGASTPTTAGGGSAGGRIDACCIYWNHNEWTLVQQEYIHFDDLATLGSKATSSDHIAPTSSKLGLNLQGMQQSLLRRNIGIVVRLQHRKFPSTKIVICACHLYWNPSFDYVKLCQAHYAIQRTIAFAKGDPVVFCGDLNSQPGGPVHKYLTYGTVNAKSFAPWHCNPRLYDSDCQNRIAKLMTDDSFTDAAKVDAVLDLFDMLDVDDPTPTVKYMLDFTLNKLTRWLRILGIDAALETEEEEKQRTKHSNFVVFDRCREEGRCLITSSTKLILRRDCPPGAHVINPKTLPDLEAALVHLFLSHGIVLEPQNFLSRCVVCNGTICDVTDKAARKRIFTAHQALSLVDDDLECYECNGCGQGYWWCDRPTSSASRVKEKATRLFELCLRAGVATKGPLCMFDFVDVEAERKKGLSINVGTEMDSLQVLEWLKQEELRCPIQLESSYALKTRNGTPIGECNPFTTVTSDFAGFLDYIFFETKSFHLEARLFLPASFNDLMNGSTLRNSHLLPSFLWPSDHLAVGAHLSVPIVHEPEITTDGFVERLGTAAVECNDATADSPNSKDCSSSSCGVILDSAKSTSNVSSSDASVLQNPLHVPTGRCGCGCIPNIPSLFEMAELRKLAKVQGKGESAR